MNTPNAARPPLPAHVLAHIATTTGVDHRQVSRRTRRDRCRRCSAWIFRGLDADLCAGDVRVDAVPLSPLGEAVAVLAGLGTWRLSVTATIGGRLQLDFRDPISIRAEPAGALERADVLPGHSCAPRQWLPPCRAPTRIPVLNRNVECGELPPF